MSKLKKGDSMTKPEINVTPLIDVLLVLLIIFMIVSPMKPARFEAKIPQPPDSTVQGSPKNPYFVVEINPDGSILVNGDRKYANYTELPKLTVDLERERSKYLEIGSFELRAFVKAPKSMGYGKVLQVIDAIKIAGIIPLSLQIDDLKG